MPRPPKPPSSPSLVSGVTAENYAKLANKFLEARDGAGFMIVRAPCFAGRGGDRQEYQNTTLSQWGAWLAYFLRKKIAAPLMGTQDHYMVPAEWPHEFDADETIQGDHKAGNAFMLLTKPGKRTVYLTPDDRLGFISHKLPQELADSPGPFRPYPKLWEFFADDPQAIMMLDRGLPFDFVTRLSRDMAIGVPKQKLRDRLRDCFQAEEEKWARIGEDRYLHKWGWKPPEPSALGIDINDFPDAPREPVAIDPAAKPAPADAPWRKQGPPSRELKALLDADPDYQANLAIWRAKQQLNVNNPK